MASRVIPIAPAVVFNGVKSLGNLRQYQDRLRTVPGYANEGDGYAINTFFRYGDTLHGAGVRIIPMPSYCGGSMCHAGHTWTFRNEQFSDDWPDYEDFGHTPEEIAEASLASAVIAHMVERRKTSYGANGRHGNFHHRMWCNTLKKSNFVPWDNLAHFNGYIHQVGDPENRTPENYQSFEQATVFNDARTVTLPSIGMSAHSFGKALPKPVAYVIDDLWNLNSDNKCWWSIIVFDSDCAAQHLGERSVEDVAVCDECGDEKNGNDAQFLHEEDCQNCDYGRYIVATEEDDAPYRTRLTFTHGKERPKWTKRHIPYAQGTMEKLRVMHVTDSKARKMVGKW